LRREFTGKPDAGKLHVRFDEGGGVNPPLLYWLPFDHLATFSYIRRQLDAVSVLERLVRLLSELIGFRADLK
jgi:hypothetical protein